MHWPPDRDNRLDIRSIKLGTLGSGGLAWTQPGWLQSILVAATDPTLAANVALYDGRDTTGEPLGTIRIMVGMTVAIPFGYPGVPLSSGLFVTIDNSTLTGSVVVGQEIRA